MQDKIIASHTGFGGYRTWILTVKLVYELSNVPDDLKWATNTHMTPFTLTFKAKLTISMVLEDLFCSFIPPPVHPYF